MGTSFPLNVLPAAAGEFRAAGGFRAASLLRAASTPFFNLQIVGEEDAMGGIISFGGVPPGVGGELSRKGVGRRRGEHVTFSPLP